MIQLCLTEKTPISPRITRFRFQHPEGAPLPVFSGGAHIMVEMQDGDILRRNAYSLISDPHDGSGYEIAVQREDGGRGGSRFMHEQAQPGMLMRLGQPVNLFGLHLNARKHLLIAGGVGITPFLAQIAELDRMGAEHELHYCVRSRDELAVDLPNAQIHVSDEGSRVDLDAILTAQPLGTHLYVCASARMIDTVLERAAELGWPPTPCIPRSFWPPRRANPSTCIAPDRTRRCMSARIKACWRRWRPQASTRRGCAGAVPAGNAKPTCWAATAR